MARLPRFCPTGLPQHIIQRGNNRQVCFVSQQDFSAYANWLHEYSLEFYVSIHAWVFMTNHVHLLATPHKENALSQMMQALGRRYVRYFNLSIVVQAHYGKGVLKVVWHNKIRTFLCASAI